jgi:outer membrane protein, multidrug efflux system
MPPYRPPAFSLQDSWKEASEGAASAPSESCQTEEQPWWQLFGDADLNALQEHALANSPTLKAAAWRVSEAWALAKADAAPLFPNLAFAPNGLNEVEFTRVYGEEDFFGQEKKNRRLRISQYTLPLAASYEVDLWGKLRYGAEASLASAEAQEEALAAARLMLTASVADVYYALRTLDAESCLLQRAIQLRQEQLEITQIRNHKGLTNYLDVSRAARELWLARAQLSQKMQARAEQEHLLAVLMGEMPGSFSQQVLSLTGAPPDFAPALPSELLRRRPDLRQAERELAAAYAAQGVAYTALFPSFAISTQIGFSSSIFSELLDWKSRFFSLAWEGFQTVFDGGQTRAGIAAAKAQFSQSLELYYGQVLSAFQEVEDALANLKWQRQALTELEAAIQEAQTTHTVALERYRQGLVTYLEVVEAERILLETQLATIGIMGAQYLSSVDLIKASGG